MFTLYTPLLCSSNMLLLPFFIMAILGSSIALPTYFTGYDSPGGVGSGFLHYLTLLPYLMEQEVGLQAANVAIHFLIDS